MKYSVVTDTEIGMPAVGKFIGGPGRDPGNVGRDKIMDPWCRPCGWCSLTHL